MTNKNDSGITEETDGTFTARTVFLLETRIPPVFLKNHLIWLHWVLVAAHGIFDLCYSMQDL